MPDDTSIRCPSCEATFPTGRHLGGHAKTHNKPAPVLDFESMLPVPACFADEADWRYACEQSRVEHPNLRRFTRDFALSEACGACTLQYQRYALSVGACHPPRNAMTPLRILEEGIVVEDEE